MNVRSVFFRVRQIAFLLFCLVAVAPAFGQLALIRQGAESTGVAKPGNWYGFAVALGDFNGNGFADLATGAPLEKTASETFSSGRVVVNPGTPYGLTWAGAYSLSVSDGGLDPAQTHQMGRSLAVGDFNGDGYDDLAVGLPLSTVAGQGAAGRVLVYYGGPGGLSGSPTVINRAGAEGNDLFGMALGAGRLGSDEYDDLVIGAPGMDVARGAVFVIRGSPSGLNLPGTQLLRGADLGHANDIDDAFGSAIAIGNIVGSSSGELIVGAPHASLTPGVPSSGMVYIATASDQSAGGSSLIVTAMDFGDVLFPNGQFGAALSVGRFWGDTTLDLAIGAPNTHDSGRVYVGRGTPLGINWALTLEQSEFPAAGDRFGAALAAGDHNLSGYDDLAVGVPHKDFVLAFFGNDTGMVNIFPGGPGGPSQAEAIAWWTVDLGDEFYQTSWLGHSLAAGRTSAAPRHSFVAGAPLRNEARGQVFDIAPWRQVMRPLCRSAIAVDCDDNIIYALRPFDQVKIASTTKIMTVLLAAEATERPLNDPWRVNLQDEYTIQQWMYGAYPLTSGCSIFGFTPLPPAISETFTFEDLLHACLMPSGNDAAYAIADAMIGEIDEWDGIHSVPQFVNLMNTRAVEIGMTNTFFTNPAGTDPGDPFSTAFDMWLLAREAMANPLFRQVANTESYWVDKIMPGAESGIWQVVPTNQKYNWLTNMKGRDSRIVGLKPGGTPAAKRTGVVAAKFDEPGNRLAYAAGFRWENPDYGWDRLTELVQLGLNFCRVDFGTADGFSAPPPSHQSDPIARETFRYGSPRPTAVQFNSYGGAEPGPHDPAAPSGSLDIIDVRAFNHGDTAATAEAIWKYRAMWIMEPRSQAGLRIGPVAGGNVRLHLPIDETGERPPDANILLSGSFHPAGPEAVVLPHGEDYFPAAWNDFSISAGPVELVIENDGNETIVLALDASFDLEMEFDGTPGEMFHARLEPLMASERTGHLVCRGESSGEEDFAVEIVIEDRQAGARFIPPFVITAFEHQPLERLDRLRLNFAALDWEWSLEPFVEGFVIETTDSLSEGTWQEIDAIPAGEPANYSWEQELAAQPRRFLRVRATGQPLD